MSTKDKRVSQISFVIEQINLELSKTVDLRVITGEEWTQEDLELLLISHQSVLDAIKTRTKVFERLVAVHEAACEAS